MSLNMTLVFPLKKKKIVSVDCPKCCPCFGVSLLSFFLTGSLTVKNWKFTELNL